MAKNVYPPCREGLLCFGDYDFKILLLVDNAPAHPHNLNDLYDNVKVVFLPPNTTALIQPMNNGVIAAFKAYYLRRTFDQLLVVTDGEDKLSIR
jgi:hypothetical protein